MKPKNCLIFGASGLIGRNLIRKLTNNNFKVTAVTRNVHQKGYLLKTQANPGYIDIVEANIFDVNKINNLISNADICINLIGILYQKGEINTFKNIHQKIPGLLARLCEKNNIKQFIHLSALGIEQAKDSLYAKSKLNGEIIARENFKLATIIKPSLVYGPSDQSTNFFYRLMNLLPVFFPIYYGGKTKFFPLFIGDLVEIIYQIIIQNIDSKTIECIGPQEMSFKEILQRLLKLINKKKIFLSVPIPIAKIIAAILQIMPKPLLTLDALNLLKTGSVPSGKYPTNNNLNLPAIANFENEVSKYSFLYADRGEYSKRKFKKI